MSETPRETFEALLAEWVKTETDYEGEGPQAADREQMARFTRALETKRAAWLARFDAACSPAEGRQPHARDSSGELIYPLHGVYGEAQQAKLRAWSATSGDAAAKVPRVPAHIIEACAKEYALRRAEGRFGYDTDDHRKAFIRGYVACAVTFAKGVDWEGSAPLDEAAAPAPAVTSASSAIADCSAGYHGWLWGDDDLHGPCCRCNEPASEAPTWSPTAPRDPRRLPQ